MANPSRLFERRPGSRSRCLLLLVLAARGQAGGGPSEGGEVCTNATSLAGIGGPALLRSYVAEPDLQQLEALIAKVNDGGHPDLAQQHRSFGEGGDTEVGHAVTFLHLDAPENVRSLMWEVAKAADSGGSSATPRWGMAGRLEGGMPALRCLEGIRYFPADRQEGGSFNELSWHHDGPTIFTVAVSLSSAGHDFQGGEVELHGTGETHSVADLQRGDALVWRGWDMHRVNPVLNGSRTVVVAEWWLGPPCSETVARPLDTEEAVRRAIELDSNSTVLLRLLAKFLEQRGDIEGASDTLHRAVLGATAGTGEQAWREKQQLSDVLNDLGHYQIQTSHTVLAEAQFRAALRLNPKHAKAHYNLGTILIRKRDLTGAKASFQAAVDADPSYALARFNLASFVKADGDLAAAEQHIRLALQQEPRNAMGLRNLGSTLRALGDLTGAKESYKSALDVEPGHMKARKALCEVLQQLGEKEDPAAPDCPA